MILVSGANGNLGKSIVKHLKVPFIKGSSTGPIDAKTRRINFDQPQSLDFSGIHTLLLISTMAEHRFIQHKNAIDAAKEQEVKHIFYTGTALKDIRSSQVKDLMWSHFETEEYLKTCGLSYTIVRNTMYAEAIPQLLSPLQANEILPTGKGRVPFALRDELGEAIAALLSQSGHENKTYHLLGDTAYTFEEIARALHPGEASFTSLSISAYEQRITDLPDLLKYLYKGSILDIRDGQFDLPQEALSLSSLLGRPTATLKKMTIG